MTRPHCPACAKPLEVHCAHCGAEVPTETLGAQRNTDTSRQSSEPRQSGAPQTARHTPLTSTVAKAPSKAAVQPAAPSMFGALGIGMGVGTIAVAVFLLFAARDVEYASRPVEGFETPVSPARNAARSGQSVEAQTSPGDLNAMGDDPSRGDPHTRNVDAELADAPTVIDSFSQSSAPPTDVSAPFFGEVSAAPSRRGAEFAVDSLAADAVSLKIPASARTLTGVGIHPGAPCVLDLTLSNNQVAGLKVLCANDTLYDSQLQQSETSKRQSSVFEVHGREPGAWAYRLRYLDVDEAVGLKVRIDTFKMRGSVRVGPVQADLRLAGQTLDRKGESLFGMPSKVYRFSRDIKRNTAAGEVPWPVPDPCAVQTWLAMASPNALICKTELRCGNRLLYGIGQGGLGPCTVKDRQITGFHDIMHSSGDQDPALTFNVDEGQLNIEDSWQDAQYRVVFDWAY